MITFLTGPRRCFLASSALVKRPVDSITTCAPTDSHGNLAGSFSANTLKVLSSTVMLSAPAETLLCRLPRTESYLRRWARVLGSVRSLTATNSRLGSLSEARRTLRPMRPKPLIPTLIAILPPRITRHRLIKMNQGTELKMVTGEAEGRQMKETPGGTFGHWYSHIGKTHPNRGAGGFSTASLFIGCGRANQAIAVGGEIHHRVECRQAQDVRLQSRLQAGGYLVQAIGAGTNVDHVEHAGIFRVDSLCVDLVLVDRAVRHHLFHQRNNQVLAEGLYGISGRIRFELVTRLVSIEIFPRTGVPVVVVADVKIVPMLGRARQHGSSGVSLLVELVENRSEERRVGKEGRS